jgi:fructan beta-fructosidase
VQRPIRELESLRHERFRVENSRLDGDGFNRKIQQAGIKGETYEFEAELKPEQAGEIGFRLRKSKDAETLVGFDAARGEVFVDRTRSGNVSFSKDFPGRHAARLEKNASVKLHVFVDRSSVEVFANDGERVLSERIYPPPGSDGIEVYAKGAGGRIVSLTIWELNSIWK